MRIAFVSREIAGVRGGGIGTYVAEAGRALQAAGHECWLVTDTPCPGEIPGFARVIEVKAEVAHGLPFLFGAPHYDYAARVAETIGDLDLEFDYIEFADYQAEGVLALREHAQFRAFGRAVLAVTLHSPTYECYEANSQLHRADQVVWETIALEDAMLREAVWLNSPSKGLRDRVCARLGRDPTAVELVRYPMEFEVDAAEFGPVATLEDVRFAFFGRIEPRKGVEELVEAFARMPELSLELIGADTDSSPYGRSLREWLERRATGNVTFVGALDRDALFARLRRVHVCVLPSRFENWPNACLEAMGLGRVVIGGRDGGMSEMIDDGRTGFLVDGGDASDIERVIREGIGGRLAELPRIGRDAARSIREIADPKRYAETIERSVELRRAASRPLPSNVDSLVSIVIPFYRDRDTVEAAVRSACDQTHSRVEVLVVDDGSPLDDADEILSRLEAVDPRVRVLRKANGGLSSARNHGIEAASGEFLLFLDADNTVRPEYAATAVQALAAHPDRGFAVPQVRYYDDATGDDVGIYNPLPYVRGFALMINRFGDAGAFFRRSVFVDHGLRYDELLISFEDWALWMDLDRLGVRGVAIPRVLYDYRMRSDSMMQADAWPNFRALVGLLVGRHLTDDASEQQMLWSLNQTWGRDASLWDRAREEKGRWPLRYHVVDKVYGACKKVPGVGTLADWIGGRLRPGRR